MSAQFQRRQPFFQALEKAAAVLPHEYCPAPPPPPPRVEAGVVDDSIYFICFGDCSHVTTYMVQRPASTKALHACDIKVHWACDSTFHFMSIQNSK